MLRRAVADPVVPSQHDPSTFTGDLQPHLVIGVLREEVIVCDDGRVHLLEAFRHLAMAEDAIAEELRRPGHRA